MASKKVKLYTNEQGQIVLEHCDGTTDIIDPPCGCESDPTTDDGGIPPMYPSDGKKCQAATLLTNWVVGEVIDWAQILDSYPPTSPLFIAAIVDKIRLRGWELSLYPAIHNWLIQVGLIASQAAFEADEMSGATKEKIICRLLSCLTGISDITPSVVQCWKDGIRALKDEAPESQDALEAMYGFLSWLPLAVVRERAFDASIGNTTYNCNFCGSVGEIVECDNVNTYIWSVLRYDDPRLSGGSLTCYGEGRYSGGVCPNNLQGHDGFLATLDDPMCIREFRFYMAGNSGEDWTRAALKVNGVQIREMQRVDSGQSLNCPTNVDKALYQFKFDEPIQCTSFELVPITKVGTGLLDGMHLFCVKIEVGTFVDL